MDTAQLGTKKVPAIIGAVIVVAALGCGVAYSYGLYKDLRATQKELAARTAEFDNGRKQLEQKIAEVQMENDEITATLSDQQKANLELEREKRRNERKIDTLTKLTTIDPELLKKYSKVYFLSENYVPAKLENIDSKYLIDPAKQIQFLDDAWPHFEDLLQEADDDGVQLKVLSAYRSFATQQQLKSGYLVQYGTGANRFSAEQGYSEHQLGTAADFTTPTVRGAYLSFENTTAFAWLVKNAYKYGFILSYPKGQSYYIYEPWHWRFVGEDLADHLHDEGLYFYQMDQREIDEYLISIFD